MTRNNSRMFALALGLLLSLAFVTAAPALAASDQGGGRVCFGNNLTLGSGESADSLLAFGCNVTVQQGATVRGDLVDFGGNVTIEQGATLNDDLLVFGGNILLAGAVEGNIASFGGNITMRETGKVNGNINAMGGSVQRDPGAIVQGSVNTNRNNVTVPFTRRFDTQFDLLGGIVTALAFAALGALVVIFAPTATRRVSEAAQNKPLNTAGVGCLAVFLLPILCVLLSITIIGIPVALILGFLSVVGWIFGSIGVGLLAGEKILQAFKAKDILPVLAVVIGVVVLMILGQVPIIGWIISFVVGLIGLGAVVMTRFGTRTYPIVPGMMLVPVAATASPSSSPVPGTYTPTAADLAVRQEREDQTQQQQWASPPSQPPQVEPPAGPGAEPPATPGDTEPKG